MLYELSFVYAISKITAYTQQFFLLYDIIMEHFVYSFCHRQDKYMFYAVGMS